MIRDKDRVTQTEIVIKKKRDKCASDNEWKREKDRKRECV